jgi:hypothetical protein
MGRKKKWSFCVSIGHQIILFFARMCRGPDEELRGGRLLSRTLRQVKEGSGNEMSLSMGAL